MKRLSPEIVHIIASLLDVGDLLNFRLVHKAYADIGAAYLLPEVTVHAHELELERLRAISLHPVFSRYVQSLLYFGDTERFPPTTFRKYLKAYGTERSISYAVRGFAGSGGEQEPQQNPPTMEQLALEYGKYVAASRNQHHVLTARLDVAALEEVLPRLPNLRELTMSECNQFHSGRHPHPRKTPFNDMLRVSFVKRDRLRGSRHLEALLQANQTAAVGRRGIQSLRAGLLHWEFFDRGAADLQRLFAPLSTSLKRFEFVVSVEAETHHEDLESDRMDLDMTIWFFKDMMAKNAVRGLLSSMPELETLAAEFNCYDEHLFVGAVARLRHLIQPGYQWKNLRRLVLTGVICSRQELMGVLKLHKGTLRHICLQDIDLETTSWSRFLPWVRRNMYLHDACMCGYLHGAEEEDGGGGDEDEVINHTPPADHDTSSDVDDDGAEGLIEELWSFSSPVVGNDEMRSSVNMYCRRGGECYPDELPLSNDIVQKHYDAHVAHEFPREEEDKLLDEEYMKAASARFLEMQDQIFRDFGGDPGNNDDDDDDDDDDYDDDGGGDDEYHGPDWFMDESLSPNLPDLEDGWEDMEEEGDDVDESTVD